MIGDGLHGEDPEKVGWPIDPHGATLEERFTVMFCNDMNPSERAAFMAKVGGDMWAGERFLMAEGRPPDSAAPNAGAAESANTSSYELASPWAAVSSPYRREDLDFQNISGGVGRSARRGR
jgi:hypothetical protein